MIIFQKYITHKLSPVSIFIVKKGNEDVTDVYLIKYVLKICQITKKQSKYSLITPDIAKNSCVQLAAIILLFCYYFIIKL